MIRHRPSPQVVIVLAAVTLGAAVLGALWFFSDSRAAGQAHDEALARWESKEPAAYSFDFSHCGGMCAYCLLHVTVTNGKVTDAVGRKGDCAGYDVQNAPTIEDVFAMEEDERSGELADSFEIRYDRTWGFPALVEINCPDGYLDCGAGYTVTDFQAFP